jgi:hypothetical protein
MTVLESLRTRLTAFDRKSFSCLTEAAAALSDKADYGAALVELAGDEGASSGATWLIKHHAENGTPLPVPLCKDLADRLPQITAWDAQLHICQSARHLPYPDTATGQLLAFARPLLTHERPFLRAWSLDLLCYLTTRIPDLATEAETALARAAEDPAASVRARARNLTKQKTCRSTRF